MKGRLKGRDTKDSARSTPDTVRHGGVATAPHEPSASPAGEIERSNETREETGACGVYPIYKPSQRTCSAYGLLVVVLREHKHSHRPT